MLLNQPSMNQATTVYATKRRRRNGKSAKPQPVETNSKSNPSKRHRLRLNAELDTLASLLPYDQNILSKLDRLSILRLAVAYLRTKSFFQASMIVATKEEDVPGGESGVQYRRDGMLAYDASLSGETFIQALNGFLFILDCQGEVFFSTHNIESYLGFHQSDIIHQSVFELVHSEDREELQRQFMWNGFLTPERAGMTQQEALLPENSHLLERSFTVRFRCLLDNTSGFLRLDIRGRIRALTGQSRHTEEPTLALFALCTPFGPPSLLDMPHKEVMFKSKHKLDLTMVSIDQRGKTLLGYDEEMHNQSGYALVHHDDLSYVASAHQELLKTGASGLIAYRLQTSEFGWQWLQTSSRLVYKNSKPDFVISTHRPLLEEEGRDLLGKRTMDFKVSYLDPGLSSQYLYDSEVSSGGGAAATAAATGGGGGGGGASNGKCSRRYKSQLRDFLTTCRTKRKLSADYSSSDATAAYGQYAAAGYPPAPSAYSADPSAIYNQQNFQSLYPSIDNRFLASDGLYYRQLGSYYPEYMHHGGYNGLVDVSRSGLGGYDTSSQHRSGEYSPQIDVTKYTADRAYLPKSPYYDTYPSSAIINASLGTVPVGGSSGAVGGLAAGTAASSLQEGFGGGEAVDPAAERDQRHTPERKPEITLSPGAMKSVLTHPGAVGYSNPNDARQAVLMWGGSQMPPHGVTSHVVCSPSPAETAHYAAVSGHYSPVTPPCAERGAHVGAPVPHLDPIKCMGDMSAAACKWAPRMGSASPTSRAAHNQASYSELGHTEVWAPYSLGYHSPQTAEVYPSTTARNGTICCPSLR